MPSRFWRVAAHLAVHFECDANLGFIDPSLCSNRVCWSLIVYRTGHPLPGDRGSDANRTCPRQRDFTVYHLLPPVENSNVDEPPAKVHASP